MEELDFSNEGLFDNAPEITVEFQDQYGTKYRSESEAYRLTNVPTGLVIKALRTGEVVMGWKFTFTED